LPRWRRIARRFRELAVEMGGVLIKLGQFLSIRVDILPREVTGELAGLQDEVPPERLEDITMQMAADFKRPIMEIFQWISPEPLGSASLAQTHRIKTVTGEDLVVKVLRPGIDAVVETDLKAIALAFRWLKLSRRVRKWVDLDWLAAEFKSVTRRELDLQAEGRNVERFAEEFADFPNVCVPKVYWEYCAPRTLALENVGYIKITDLQTMEAAGIQGREVADGLYQIYMRQVFETYFVHVDPHPGNLFVKPLPVPDEAAEGRSGFGPQEPVPYEPGRPFQIVLVDFGMAVVIPERLRAALREYAIGVGTRDVFRIVQSYVRAGALLPGADIRRLEEAHETLFNRFWGLRVGQFRDVFSEARSFISEYRDVILDSPFQFQADMLFVLRAVGILSGLATHLDPEFDPWSKTIPFAERFAKEELRRNWQEWMREIAVIGQNLLKLPTELERVLTDSRRGRLALRTQLSAESREILKRLERSVKRLTWAVTGCGLLIAGATLYAGDRAPVSAEILIVTALLLMVWGLTKK
jgi:predicted unusual protein kinase regulating ubiquinone biosynthesis (AarF/ABC1/UbiB family)